MILDGLRPQDKQFVRAMIGALVQKYPDVPSLRKYAYAPSSEYEGIADRFLAACCYLAYLDGYYAHRRATLDELVEKGLATPEDVCA